MDCDDRIPQRLVHLEEALVAQDARVVHEDVGPAKDVDRGLDDGGRPLRRRHACLACHRCAAGGSDFFGDPARGAHVGALAVASTAGVIDDDASALPGE